MSSDAILIVDSLPALRRYAAQLVMQTLDANAAIILEAGDGATAIDLANKSRISLLIIDAAIPGTDGIHVAAEIWRAQPQTKIMFWTQHHREIFMHKLKQIVPDAQVFAYVLKNSEERKFQHAIASICIHNNVYIDPSIRRPNTGIKLTEGEFEVLQDMALGLTEKAIARRRQLTVRGVQSRAASIYDKLLPKKVDDVFNRRALAFSEAIRHGLIEPDSLAVWQADLHHWLGADAS